MESETIKEIDGDLRCEEAIMDDKTRFGRVRKSMMMHLREEYGSKLQTGHYGESIGEGLKDIFRVDNYLVFVGFSLTMSPKII